MLNDPFTVNLPHLDLHGETRETAPFLINTFIKDNYIMGKLNVVIIHGYHSDVLKKVCNEILNKNEYVTKYNINSNNPGETIVNIKSR